GARVARPARALPREPERERARREPAVAAAPRVAEGLLLGLRGLPQALERLGRAVTVVGAAGRQELLGVGAVDRQALGLAVAGRRRALVPVEAEPRERLGDARDVLLGGARAVGVLDPEDEGAALVARVEPVEERGAGAADVQVSGRARRETHADGRAHVAVSSLIADTSTFYRARNGSGHGRRG